MPIVLRPPGSRPGLPDQLAGLGRARRRVSVAAGVFGLVGVAAGLALAAGALDAWLHLPPLARAFLLVGTLAAAGVILLRGILLPLRLPTAPLAVALELEELHPKLNDVLASAVSFLGDGDEPAGVSNRLAAEAVRKAERAADRLATRAELERFVPSGRFWRAFALAGVVLGVGVPLVAWDTARAGTALVRLADPFGNHPWPSKTRLQLIAPAKLPHRMPRGDAFELHFAVRGLIPDRAVVMVRGAAGEFEEAYPLAKGGDPKEPEKAVVTAKLDPSRVSANFSFRVVANDADTGWQDVAVVPPPRLVPLDGRATPQFHAVPPAYTGLRPIDLPDGAGVIEVPAGSVVTLRAATDVRLSAASLSYLGDKTHLERAAGLAHLGHTNPLAGLGAQLLADAIGTDIPVSLDAEGRVLAVTFTPSLAGMYALKLADETGLVGTRLLEIRLNPDPPPTVSLLRPSPGHDPPLLVPEAAVLVHVAAEDKVYALRRVFLEYRVGGSAQVRTLVLADAKTAADTLPALVGGLAASERPQPPRYEGRVLVPLALFLRDDGTPVRDGDVLFLRAAADDWDDVTVLKEPGRTGEVEIRVASKEAVEAWLQKELAALRPELIRLRDQQRDAKARTADAVPKPDGTLTPADREKLLGAEQVQRQIRAKVTDPRDGLRSRAEMLREVVRANGLPKSTTTDRVEVVADELGRTADRDLGVIEPLLGDARQAGAQPPRPGSEKLAAEKLTRAGRHQASVEETLTNLIDLLSLWGGAGEIRGEARVLKDAVTREAGTADRMNEKVPPGKSPDALALNQKAELDRAAGKFDNQADAAGRLLDRAAKLAAEKDKQAADLRAAADGKEKEAADLRKKAAGLPADSPDRKALDAKAAALTAEAAELRAAADKAKAEADALRKAVEAAGGQALPDDLRKAADAMRNNRQSEAAALARSAADRLDKLAGTLAEKPDDAVPELARKKKDAADRLDALAGAQDDLRKRTEEAGKIADPEKREAALKKLAAEQQKLIDEAKDLLQRLTRDRGEDAARDVRGAIDRMEGARDDLEAGKTPTPAQKDAVEKLDAARDKLDAAAAGADRRLADEKRRKLFDQVKALLDRQKAAAAEAARIQEKLLKDKKWERPLLESYVDLEDRERVLATEVRAIADREFVGLPVFARLLKDAADAVEKAADKAKDRRQDALDADPGAAFDPELEKANDARVRRPMDVAARRLELLLDSLKPDDPRKKDGGPKGPPQAKKDGGGPMPPPMGGGPKGNEDVVPPLTQLKALRALQADLNQRTAEFARSHPDPDKLTDEEKDELRDLEQAQREVAALFEELAKLFQKQPPSDPGKDQP